MKKGSVYLCVAFIASTLLLTAYFWLRDSTRSEEFLFGGVEGSSIFRAITHVAVIMVTGGWFATVAVVALSLAFRPAGFIRKLWSLIPTFILLFTVAGAVRYSLGIDTKRITLGAWALPLNLAWVWVGVLLCCLFVVMAISHPTYLTYPHKQRQFRMLSLLSTIPSSVAGLALIVVAVLLVESRDLLPFTAMRLDPAIDSVPQPYLVLSYVDTGDGDYERPIDFDQLGFVPMTDSKLITKIDSLINHYLLAGGLMAIFGATHLVYIIGEYRRSAERLVQRV